MKNKTRVLFATCFLLMGWLIGFVMGGGARSASMEAGAAESAATAARRAELEAMARRVGMPERMEGQFDETRDVDWTRERLQNAARGILRHGDFLTLMRKGIAFTDQLRKDDFPLALEVAHTFKGEDDMAEALGFAMFLRWVELDPHAAAEHLRKTDGFGWFNFQAPMLAMGWAQSNPAEALAFARTLKDESDRDNFIKGILKAMARSSPEEAVTFAKSHASDLPIDKLLGEALGDSGAGLGAEEVAKRMVELGTTERLDDVVLRWAKADQKAALAWAAGLTDPGQRAAALNGVFGVLTEKDVRAAGVELLRLEVRDGLLSPAINGIAHAWPENDLAGAVVWAGKLADEKHRNEAFRYLASRMGSAQPEAGAAWLRTLPEGTGRDGAVAAYVEQAVKKDGAAAIEWAGTISSREKRIESMHNASVEWFSRDAARALDWINTTQVLSPEDKRAMLGGK